MNNNYLKLNQVILKLFNNNYNLVSKTFNPVFPLNLHIYKSLAFIYNLFNRNSNFISSKYLCIFISRFKTISKLFFYTFVCIYYKYTYYIELKLE